MLGNRVFARAVWVLVALLTGLCVLAAPSVAGAAEPPEADECRRAPLAHARVSASLALQHDDRTYTKIITKLVVDVPGDWPFAQDLLLSEESRKYIRAMACLTRSKQSKQQRHWEEWRTGDPVVTSRDGRIKVVDTAHSWVDQYRSDIEVGVWNVRAGARRWLVRLQVPPALVGARWDKITVEPGAPGAESAEPRPDAGEGTTALVWRPARQDQSKASEKRRPEEKQASKAARTAETARQGRGATAEARAGSVPLVVVSLRPSWQRSWAAQSDRLIAVGMGEAGELLWMGAVSALLLMAAREYRRRPGTPTADQRHTMRNLVAWAVLSVALNVLTRTDEMIDRYVQRRADGRWLSEWIFFGHYGLALVVAALLLAFSRPPRRVGLAALLLVLVPLANTAPTGVLGLSKTPFTSDAGLVVQSLSACSVIALTLLGFVAAAWRLAIDGHLLPESRRFPGNDRVLRMRIAGPAVAVATVVIAICFALAEERTWQRISWLSDPADPEYGSDRRSVLVSNVVMSVSDGLDWINGYHWLLTAVAALAVLRTWRTSPSLSPLDEQADRAERLLFLTFYAAAVGLGGGWTLGIGLLNGLWIPLHMLALYGATTLFMRRSVLAQPLEVSRQPFFEGLGPGARTQLLRKARAYRETHANLRRLDQGLFGDEPPKRADEERDLSTLHDWPAIGSLAAPDRLPSQVSVVDAALALGPRDHWWANGSRGARLALIPGLPTAVLTTWAWTIRGEAWENTLSYQFGFPDVMLNFLFWMVTWAAAGFVLGALWRVLPGRRGAVKAIPVTFAFALSTALDAMLAWFTNDSVADLSLHILAMLFVLTVTGIALDLDTFRGERRYWQSRLGLLLSVYQMRYYSLQLAYLIAQVIAIITIWQFFAEPAVTPDGPGNQ
ncbi:DUF6185 family protein [Streptomyces milbemycinicus]|uniref:DUF6185 family protein n=1 Tax=Streptomyces milbemycinicus TaxID=476552 RepID=A0ABW8LHZ6_9ACTN